MTLVNPVVRQIKSITDVTASPSYSVVLDSTPLAGSILVYAVSTQTGYTTSSIAQSGATWNRIQIAPDNGFGGTSTRADIWLSDPVDLGGAVDTLSVTMATGLSTIGGAVMEITGIKGLPPYPNNWDKRTAVTDSSNPIDTAATAVSSHIANFAIACISKDTRDTSLTTPQNGYTLANETFGSVSQRVALLYKIETGLVTTQTGMTSSGSFTNGSAVLVTIPIPLVVGPTGSNLNAAIAAARSRESSLGVLIKAIGIEKNSDLNVAVAAVRSRESSLGAAIAVTDSIDTSLGAAIAVTGSADTSLDVAVAAARSRETELDVAIVTSPSVINQTPAPGETGVDRDESIDFWVLGPLDIDPDTFSVSIQYNSGPIMTVLDIPIFVAPISFDSSTFEGVSIDQVDPIETWDGYAVSLKPLGYWPADTVITIRINTDDLSGFSMSEESYSFTTSAADLPPASGITLIQSGSGSV